MDETRRELMGLRIRELRERRGLKQRELAKAAGLSESAERSYELGNRYPKDKHVTALAKALGVPAEAFIGDDIGTLLEAIHALFWIEGQFKFKPMLTSEGPALVAREFSQERDALRAWAQECARLDAGEITEEEYKDWKDAYVLPTTHVS